MALNITAKSRENISFIKRPDNLVINKLHIINLAIILLVGIAVYANSFGNEFVWDDDYLVVNNAFLKDWRYLGKIFSSNLFAGSWGDSTFYRPIQSLTLMIDYHLWHLNPFGYHLTNTLLHIANAVLIYLLVIYLFEACVAAMFTALLFLVHPVQTEAVTYISGRADPLMVFFLLLAFILFVRPHKTGSLLCLSLALLSKEVALIFPFLLLVYCLLDNNKKDFKTRSLFLSALFVIDGIYLLMRLFLLDFLQTVPLSSAAPLFTRLMVSCKTFVHYLGFIVFPVGLHMERHLNIRGSLLEPDIWISIILLTVFITLIFKLAKKSKMTSFGLAWFVIALLPTSALLPINAFIAEHWLYLPSIGLFLGISKRLQKINSAVFIAILIILSILSIRQNAVWKNKETIYRHILRFNPQSPRAHFNLGSAYGQKNSDDMAIDEFKTAIELKPDYVDAYVNLGYAYQKKGRIDEAAKVYKTAIDVAPDSYLPYHYLANLYNDTNRVSDSIPIYKKALDIKQANPHIYFDMGRAYDRIDNVEEAIKAYQRCIALSSSYVYAYLNLGSIYAQKGRLDEAREMWKRGLRFGPDNQDIKQNLEKLEQIRR